MVPHIKMWRPCAMSSTRKWRYMRSWSGSLDDWAACVLIVFRILLPLVRPDDTQPLGHV
ncbi:hypothetical protein B0H17DRAFT_1121575 [Mycena rosella]|nr:hypothetical protein B0H17DRAFT_1121575 [Mycena rosella]